MEESVASKVSFLDLCRLCEKICSKQGKGNKEKVLVEFINQWRNLCLRLQKKSDDNESFYPAMRLLLPKLEKERSAYGIKEVTLARLYIDILVLSKDSEEGQALLNFRTQQTNLNCGDFASIAYNILKNRCSEDSKLSISEVNGYLDDIASNSAARNKDTLKQGVMKLLKNTTALEQKWLIRMIMKDMKMGLSEQSILASFHVDAKDLYDVSNSLKKVCSTLKDPNARLHEVEVSLFSPFRPMLAERAVPDKVGKLLNNHPFVIEIKYDGERMQIHKDGEKYMFFSRNGNDYSHAFGVSSTTGTVAQYIHMLFKDNVKSCIIDGEMMGYDKISQKIGTKGQNFDVKFLQDGQDMRPMFCAFDILLLNGEILSNYPLSKRITYLKKLFTPEEGILQLSHQIIASKNEEVIAALNDGIDNREEGLVVKDLSSIYKPNTRKGGWLKLKPEYIDSLMDQLDLIIIGGYFGEGHRSGMISHFLLGVAVPNPFGGYPDEFHSFCKVGSGYTMEELKELGNKLKNHWKIYKKKDPPKNVILASGHKECPDLYIDPKNSFVAQIKASEIIISEKFKTGCTLRFPRVEKVRYDKSWFECMTLDELKNLKELASGKLASKHLINQDESNSEISPKKKRKIQVQQPIAIAPHFQGADLSSISKTSDIFNALRICIVNKSSENTKQELEKLAAEHGASIDQNPDLNTSIVLSSKIDLRTRNFILSKKYDVVKIDWFYKCINDKKFSEWVPSDMYFMTDTSSKKFMENYDKYGDSYSQTVNVEILKNIFANIDSYVPLKNTQIAEIETKYFSSTSSFGLFRLYVFYVDTVGEIFFKESGASIHDSHQSELLYSNTVIKLHGGSVRNKLDSDVSHVILKEEFLDNLKSYKTENRRRRKKFHIVSNRWIYDCIKHNKIIQEREYEPF